MTLCVHLPSLLALVTGNCIIIKPSPYSPLAALKFGELAQRVLPPGVLSILSGSDELQVNPSHTNHAFADNSIFTSGPWISEHPRIAKVSLTGSVGAGKAVMRSAAGSLKRITLELGGNDAAVVLDDVDPKSIAP